MDNPDTSTNSNNSLICSSSELEILQELCTTIIQSIDVSEFLQTLIERAGQILQVTSGSIIMLDPDGYLRIKAYFGFKEENAQAYALKPNEGRGGKIFVSGKSQIFVTSKELKKEHFHEIAHQENLEHTIGSPMIDSKKQVIGVLFLNDKKSKEPFNERDLKLLENLANLAAIAVEKQIQLEELNSQKERYRQLSEQLENSLAELNSVNERLRESNKLKDEVLSICAHDVRSPLTAIVSYAELLLDSNNLTDKQLRYLNHIHRSSEKINSLVQNLLVRARYLESNAPLRLESIYIGKMISETIQQLEDRLTSQKIKVVINDKWQKHIRADRFKIAQVIDNLIDNAVKFSPEEGEIKVDISLDKGDSKQALISISNSGQGIPAEALPKLFSRYFQVSYNKQRGGYGLGLAICKQNVEAHGGQITAESVLDEYTSFHFTLPIGIPYLLVFTDKAAFKEKIISMLPAKEYCQHDFVESEKDLLEKMTEAIPTLLIVDAEIGESNFFKLVSSLRKEFDSVRLPITVVGNNKISKELNSSAQIIADIIALDDTLKLLAE
jgi:signal transduction histidine kinase